MANDMEDVIEDFNFHPCNTPRGCNYYDMSILTDDQQISLQEFKLKRIRKNNIYLRRHPEVRAIIALIMRHVLKRKPHRDIHRCIYEIFDRPLYMIQDEVDEYLRSKGLKKFSPEEEEEEEEEEYTAGVQYSTESYFSVGEEQEVEHGGYTRQQVVRQPSDDSREWIRKLLYSAVDTMTLPHSAIYDHIYTDSIGDEYSYHSGINIEQLMIPKEPSIVNYSSDSQSYEEEEYETKTALTASTTEGKASNVSGKRVSIYTPAMQQ